MFEKHKKANLDLKTTNASLSAELEAVKDESDKLKRGTKAREADSGAKDGRLNRALEEIEKMKISAANSNADHKVGSCNDIIKLRISTR
jgi:hypothetical protein